MREPGDGAGCKPEEHAMIVPNCREPNVATKGRGCLSFVL